MNLRQKIALNHAIQELNEAARKASQSTDAEDSYERHLDVSYALGVVHGITRTIEETPHELH